MNSIKIKTAVFLSSMSVCHVGWADTEKPLSENKSNPLEEVYVWGNSQATDDAGYVSPTSTLWPDDIQAINAVTTEDLVKYEPSLVIRRRFIGDSNGTLGVRGSNMFQTARSMVFADGVPLHYLLQSRWNGAPRWTMVSADEIAQIEVIYGPFSAEYSGNAMGGVVLIETVIPEGQQFNVDLSYFSQSFNAYGFDDSVDGSKAFISYGNKLGDWSYYFSVNHLDNTAQPQTFRDSSFTPTAAADSVSGAVQGNDARGRARLWYGDTGVVDTTTNNYKLKIGYELGNWQSLLNLAFEDRESNNTGQSYVTDNQGNLVWSGTELVQAGQLFNFNSGRINANTLERQSLSVGLRLRGQILENTRLEFNVSNFSILKDEDRASELHPDDPAFTGAGQVTEYDDSGWNTVEVKTVTSDLFISGLEVITGLRYEDYELNLDVSELPDFRGTEKGDLQSRFGGQTRIGAAFLQANWRLTSQWDMAMGLRYETFKSRSGYYDEDSPLTSELDLVDIPSDSQKTWSPKFSLGFRPGDDWMLRYSIARAHRFPIVEELFSQYEAYNTVALSNPELKPEDGLHHNVMIDKQFQGGYARINFFQESVDNAIESQTDTSTNVRSFVPIDEVRVKGVELILNQSGVLIDELDLRFNVTWTDAEIVDNSTAEGVNPVDSIEGNTYPRMPKWRSNLLATYYLTDSWNISANVQYASDSFGRNSNEDTEENVYGAQDAYTRFGFKTAYQVNPQWELSFGVDNITNEVDYVAHPWPGRTAFLNLSFGL